jgi:nitrogen fixation/metabolism regulation signal transduction histidine kinase
VPGCVVALGLLWAGDYSSKLRWTLVTFMGVGWGLVALALRERVVRPLQTIANLLSGLREGDYSIRARGAQPDDALGEVLLEINSLGETLQAQRRDAVEATALLRSVMAEIDVAVFTFDEHQRLRLVNRAGERLMAQSAERLLGRTAEELGIAQCLAEDCPCTLNRSFPGGTGRWGLRWTTFRENGMPHQLVVLSDLSRELREEERQAWQRLVRVLGHELNNSLAPIKSIAGSLGTLLQRDPLPDDWKEDTQHGLEIIHSRSDALSRFMGAYARLAKLPPPRLQPIDLAPLLQRVAALETRLPVTLNEGPSLRLQADGDQLEQLLINLVRNAADAVLELAHPESQPDLVTVTWTRMPGQVEITVEDRGPGLSNTANLFVPFFTTKPKGTGIGLLLSRQLAEAHGGQLNLENRTDTRGCRVRLRLPLPNA